MRLDAIDAAFAPLADLPHGVWTPTMGNGVGEPIARLAFVRTLNAALLRGELPAKPETETTHFDAIFALHFREAIGSLGLTQFTRDRPDTVERVLRALLWHLDRIATYQDRLGESLESAQSRARDAFVAEWQEVVSDWQDVYAIFESIGALDLASDPSAMKGLLARDGWQAVRRAHALIATLPEVQKLIATLGRSVPAARVNTMTPVETHVDVEEMVSTLSIRACLVERQGAHVDGVMRSDDIAAMLPSEALLRCRPGLKRLWRARFVEHQLMTYQRKVSLDVPAPQRMSRIVSKRVMQPPPEFETGPVVICVDTSSSMRGPKEAIVKATVFEAMRVAHHQHRACYVYAFSDETSVTEHAVSLDTKGLSALVDFLELSFHGGTDVADVIERAIARVESDAWRAADILIASDGEFGVTRATQARIDAAKRDLRLAVFGVLAGDRETIGMRGVCDEIVWMKNWRTFDTQGGDAGSPVHARDLTARYFPNALKSSH